MPRRYNPSQIRSKLRQIQSKIKQDLSRIEREARQRQQKLRQAGNELDRAIRGYKQAARTHDARVRANRARINSALSRLRSAPSVTTHVVYRTSTQQLHESFVRLERVAKSSAHTDVQRLFELSEAENANSLEASEALLGLETPEDEEDDESLNTSQIAQELQGISDDLHLRWEGAVYSLSPRNPDASRHFCTSAREIFIQILDTFAPNEEVLRLVAECPVTDQGVPIRRAKVHYLLSRKGVDCDELEEFVEKDIGNVLELFGVFNAGTHGSSGKYSTSQLVKIKRRVEDGIRFLCRVVQP